MSAHATVERSDPLLCEGSQQRNNQRERQARVPERVDGSRARILGECGPIDVVEFDGVVGLTLRGEQRETRLGVVFRPIGLKLLRAEANVSAATTRRKDSQFDKEAGHDGREQTSLRFSWLLGQGSNFTTHKDEEEVD